MLIKICGLTDISEAIYLKENKVDFAGMVLFYERSKRNITVEKAKEIMEHLQPDIKAVAVTVAPSVEQVHEIENAGFDYIQIHDKVSDELLSSCKIPVLKAFNVDDLEFYEHYLSIFNIKGFVFDAGLPGSGKTFDWNMVKGLRRDDSRLYILAGGLNADNVAEAINTVSPDGVDVSSGVEYLDKLGKDPDKISRFVNNVRSFIATDK